MQEKRFVLFDFDGVIADSQALSYELSRHFHPGLDEHIYQALYEDNIFESLKKLSSWRETLPEEYQQKFDPRMKDEVRLIVGMDGVIKALSGSYTLAIISSTSMSGITEFLKSHNLTDYFSDVLGRDSHHSKVEKMAMIFAKYSVTAAQCVYITDTLGDMREAQEHGMGTIASSWGVHPRETLEQGVPFRILNTPEELPDAVDDYFAR
jgi:HAD superfamily hydrolase (TIGR01549 family)